MANAVISVAYKLTLGASPPILPHQVFRIACEFWHPGWWLGGRPFGWANVPSMVSHESGENYLEIHRADYVKTYNHPISQRALKHISPVQAMKDWHAKKPELFKKRVYNQPGLDN
jgi:hypothetical protein